MHQYIIRRLTSLVIHSSPVKWLVKPYLININFNIKKRKIINYVSKSTFLKLKKNKAREKEKKEYGYEHQLFSKNKNTREKKGSKKKVTITCYIRENIFKKWERIQK